MALKVAFQMDPIERIDIRGDSTFALLLEAQWRGHDVFYYTPDHLSLRDGKLMAQGHSLTVEDSPGDHYRLPHPPSRALRPGLYPHRPSPGAPPAQDARGQRSWSRAQFAGEGVCARLSRPDA